MELGVASVNCKSSKRRTIPVAVNPPRIPTPMPAPSNNNSRMTTHANLRCHLVVSRKNTGVATPFPQCMCCSTDGATDIAGRYILPVSVFVEQCFYFTLLSALNGAESKVSGGAIVCQETTHQLVTKTSYKILDNDIKVAWINPRLMSKVDMQAITSRQEYTATATLNMNGQCYNRNNVTTVANLHPTQQQQQLHHRPPKTQARVADEWEMNESCYAAKVRVAGASVLPNASAVAHHRSASAMRSAGAAGTSSSSTSSSLRPPPTAAPRSSSANLSKHVYKNLKTNSGGALNVAVSSPVANSSSSVEHKVRSYLAYAAGVSEGSVVVDHGGGGAGGFAGAAALGGVYSETRYAFAVNGMPGNPAQASAAAAFFARKGLKKIVMYMSRVDESETDLFRERKCACGPLWCCGILIPQRYIVILYLLLVQTLIYCLITSDQNVFTAGFVEFDNILEESLCWPPNSTYYMKPYYPINYLSESIEGFWLDWSQLGILINTFAFPTGYGVGHIPGMILADKYGGKLFVFGSVFLCSCLHLVTPFILNNALWYHVACLKFFQGLVLGPYYPVLITMFVRWTPLPERATMLSVVVTGRDFGFLLGSGLPIIFIEYIGVWQGQFYCVVAMTWLWLIVFNIKCYTEPRDNPYISPKELALIEGSYERSQLLSSKIKSTPFLEIITNLPMLAFLLCSVTQHFSKLIFTIVITTFQRDILNVHPASIAAIAYIHSVASIIGCLSSGVLCDYINRHKLVKFENSRRYFLCASSLALGFCLIPVIYHWCDITKIYAFIVIAGFFLGVHGSILRVNMLDLSRNYCGTVMGLSQGFAILVSDLILLLLYILLRLDEDGFAILFFGTMGLLFFTTFIEYVRTTTKEQSFNNHISKKEQLKQSPTYPARF